MSFHSEALELLIGARVVRGPDWKWGDQDGGDGHVGTLRTFQSSEEAAVVWDYGVVALYRDNGARDLRILDSAPAGVKHDSILCNGCNMKPLIGTRWKCLDCEDYDLCSLCYHGDKHYLQHKFYSIDLKGKTRKVPRARRDSDKISAYGLFPGAKVKRGIDWERGSQDNNITGKLKEIGDWSESKPRSAASVVWGFGTKYYYRVGYEGKVDLIAIGNAEGYSFYYDHLPVLGMSVISNIRAVDNLSKSNYRLDVPPLLPLNQNKWKNEIEEVDITANSNAEGNLHYYEDLPVHGMNVTGTTETVDDLLMIESDLDVPPLLPMDQGKLEDEKDEVILYVSAFFINLNVVEILFLFIRTFFN